MKRAAMVIVCALLVTGCAEQPKRRQIAHFTPAPIVPSGPVQYCFDGAPCISNALPFIYGGRDLSLPTTPEVAAAYKNLGIVWAGNGCPAGANGCSSHGPHVAFGGRCLDPPPPGTRDYNDIVMGVGVTNWLYPLWRQRH